MNEERCCMPFGLVFEEEARQPEKLISPSYDEGTDLSYVEDSEGHKIAYVEFGNISVGTDTATKALPETADRDFVDDDAASFAKWGTQTITAVAEESTDEDEDVDVSKHTGTGTETLTEVRSESTDED